jgi:hypothetical protein
MRVKRGSRNCDTEEEDADLTKREGSPSPASLTFSLLNDEDSSLGLFVAALLLLPRRSLETGNGGKAVVGGPIKGLGRVAVAMADKNPEGS